MSHLVEHWWFEIARKRITDQKGLWVNAFLRQMALALIGMFSIIFVFEFGRSGFLGGGVEGGLKLVIAYLLVIRSVMLLLVIWIGNYVIRRIGYRWGVMLSLVFTSWGYWVLATASRNQDLKLVFGGAVLMGLGACGYWPMWFTLVPECEKEERMGKAVGMINVIVGLGQALAPLLAAVIISSWGYDKLFYVGIGLLLVSGIPLFFLNHHLHLDTVGWREFGRWCKEAVFLRAGIAMGGKFIDDLMYMDFWPIYLLLVVGSVNSLGWFKTGVLLIGVVFTYVVAGVFDRGADKKVQLVGVTGGVMMWLLRILPKEALKVLVIDSSDRFFAAINSTFFQGHTCKRARGPETFSFAVYRLVWESLIGVAVLAMMWWVLGQWGVSGFWVVVVGLGSFGLVLSLLMEEHHRAKA